MKVRAHTLSPFVARGIAVISAPVFATGASTALAAGVVGAGTADSCTDAARVATRLRSGRAGVLAVVGGALCTLLAAAPARAVCIGDCNNMCQVVVSNMIVGVNIVLGNAQPNACPAFQNASRNVDVAQLVKGVNNLLSGCNPDSCFGPTETPTVSPTETPTQGPTLTGELTERGDIRRCTPTRCGSFPRSIRGG